MMAANADQASWFDSEPGFAGDTMDFRMRCIVRFARQTLFGEKTSGKPPARILDVGCAGGGLLSAFPEVPERHGLDISPRYVQMATARGIRAQVFDADHQSIPMPDDYFQAVFATDVIEHLLHTDHLLNEFNRVLMPGGWLIATIPNPNQPVSLFMQFLCDLTPMYSARYRSLYYRDFSHRLFKAILKKHGFAVERTHGLFIHPFDSFPPFRWLAGAVPRWGSLLAFAARKDARVVVPEGFSSNMPELLRWLRAPEPVHNASNPSQPS